MMMGSATRIQNEVVDVLLLASVTDTVICQLPIAPGVPLICPLDETDRPAVLAFDERRYVYGGQPPETLTCIGEMASFLDAATSAIDERDRGGQVTVIVKLHDAGLLTLSLAVTVTVYVSTTLAVPVIEPFDPSGPLDEIERARPGDGLTDRGENAYGGRPPDAVAWMPLIELPCVTFWFEGTILSTQVQR